VFLSHEELARVFHDRALKLTGIVTPNRQKTLMTIGVQSQLGQYVYLFVSFIVLVTTAVATIHNFVPCNVSPGCQEQRGDEKQAKEEAPLSRGGWM
jgi:hypothetical protein